MDNSIQFKDFGKRQLRNCIHIKNIYFLVDTPKEEESYKKLNEHLLNCTICNEEFRLFQIKVSAIKNHIPKDLMARDLRESFEQEVNELFKVMEFNKREIIKKKVKKGFVFIDSIGLSFVKHLVSTTMLEIYIFSFLLYICLKIYV